LINLGAKKSVHVNITKSAHTAFRIACFERGLSMQEVFEEFAQRVALQTKDSLRVLDELKDYKESNKGMKKIYSSSDIDDIYKVLESENPLNDDGGDND
jgi:hypothetical protein